MGPFYPNVKKRNAVLRYLRWGAAGIELTAVPGLPYVCNSPRYLRWATAGTELTAVLRVSAASAKLTVVWATTSTYRTRLSIFENPFRIFET